MPVDPCRTNLIRTNPTKTAHTLPKTPKRKLFPINLAKSAYAINISLENTEPPTFPPSMSNPNRCIQYTPDCDFTKTTTKWFEPCFITFPQTLQFLHLNPPHQTQPSTKKNSPNPKGPPAPRDLSWRSFQTITHIDSGSFSTVLKVKSLATNKFYAAKVINKKMAKDVKIIDRVKREIEILFNLKKI